MEAVRLLSYSEIETAQSCFARWDFAYGGRLAGDTLKERRRAALLSNGSAWGAAVATLHQRAGQLFAREDADLALESSLFSDLIGSIDDGVDGDLAEYVLSRDYLGSLLDDYVIRDDRPMTGLSRMEDRVVVALPSRTGIGRSSRYRLLAMIDGWWVDENDNAWLVEFKLRNRLSSSRSIVLSRQIRWYAWALRESGVNPVGVLVDERLNAIPKPVRILKSGGPSHAKDQLTSAELYQEACRLAGETPKPDVVESLGARLWQQRVAVRFRPDELDEAGRELVGAAKLIRDLDSGEMPPIRHAVPHICNGCRYSPVCDAPNDRIAVDELFTRTVPKRLRSPEER